MYVTVLTLSNESQSTQIGGRERLLLAADQIFSEDSYAEAGIASILQAAKVQAPTLYHHFGDKEGLYLAWVRAKLASLKDGFPTEQDLGVEDALIGFAVAILNHSKIRWDQVRRDGSRLPRSVEFMNEYNSTFVTPIIAVILKGRNQVNFGPNEATITAELFLAGLWLAREHPIHKENPRRAAEWWVRLFLRAHQPA